MLKKSKLDHLKLTTRYLVTNLLVLQHVYFRDALLPLPLLPRVKGWLSSVRNRNVAACSRTFFSFVKFFTCIVNRTIFLKKWLLYSR